MRLNKRAVVMSTAALTVIGGGAAVAFWTNTSVSTGSARVANPAITVSSPTTLDPALAPGTKQKYVFTVKNNGDSPAALAAIDFKVANYDGTPWAPGIGCSATDFSVGAVKVVSGGTETVFAAQSLPANTTLDIAVDLTMVLDPVNNQDGCKAQQPPLYVAVS